MWATILRYIGLELVKGLISAAKDWLAARAEKKEVEARNEIRDERSELFKELEIARKNGDITAIDAITTKLGELQS